MLIGVKNNSEIVIASGGSWAWNFVSVDAFDVSEYHHYVQTYNSTAINFYLDGEFQRAYSDTTGCDNKTDTLKISSTSVGKGWNGTIDEVAVWNKSFSSAEVLDLYKRGILNINITVRSCDDANCVGESWNTTFVNSTVQNLSQPDNQYFQWWAQFSSENSSYTPELYNVTISYSMFNITPSGPTLLTPTNGSVVTGYYNVTWTEGESNVNFNTTIIIRNSTLNIVLSQTINNGTTSFQWNTTNGSFQDGYYNATIYHCSDVCGSNSTSGGTFMIQNGTADIDTHFLIALILSYFLVAFLFYLSADTLPKNLEFLNFVPRFMALLLVTVGGSIGLSAIRNSADSLTVSTSRWLSTVQPVFSVGVWFTYFFIMFFGLVFIYSLFKMFGGMFKK